MQGKPMLRVYKRAAEILGEVGITGVHVSVTHTGEYAQAVVILEK
jgi:phosphopantetheinyl transferase (holo-ACP synthase)